MLVPVGFSVFLAIEGLADLGDLLVGQWNLERLETSLEVLNDGPAVEGNARTHHNEQPWNLTHDGMRLGQTDAIGNVRQFEYGIFDLCRCHLESAHVDEVTVATYDEQIAIGRKPTNVRGDDLGGRNRIMQVARHDHPARYDDVPLVIETDVGMLHGRASTSCKARWRGGVVGLRILGSRQMEGVGTDDSRLGRSIGVVEAREGQQLAQLLHVGRGDGGCSRLDEVDILTQGHELFTTELQ